LNQNTNTDKSSVVEVELYWDWEGDDCLLHKKNAQRRSRNGRGGGEGQAPGHKLNIIDGLTDKIIPMVTPSVILLV